MELTVIKRVRDQARRLLTALEKLAAATETRDNTSALYQKGQALPIAIMEANDDLYSAEIHWETVYEQCPNWECFLER